MGVIRQRLATTRPGNCKLDEEKVLEIKRRLRDGETLVVIEPDYPVAIDAIREIRRGARWGHVQLPAEAVVRS